jgi:NAD(P)H dehydrogenase (quinone)
VLTSEGHEGKTYELAGDDAVTLADLAAEISRQTGRDIPYRDLPQADYAAILKQVGCPRASPKGSRRGTSMPRTARCSMTAISSRS